MSDREEQIQRMAEAMVRTQAFNKDFAKAIAADMWNAGARIPDPTAPKEPEVVVSDEARAAIIQGNVDGWGYNRILAAAFPILLRDNQWAVDAEIRRRIEKYVARMPHVSVHMIAADRAWLLAALGVTP